MSVNKKDVPLTDEQAFLLNRESALAAMSLSQGLTMLRKSDFVTHGYGSQSFFLLSIGIERLLKLIVIYDHRRRNNNRFPDNGVLKKHGHDIRSLFNSAKRIAAEIQFESGYSEIEQDPIYDLIIQFLTDFAHTARYYNLDKLTGHNTITDEPLRRWSREINKIILERHYIVNKKKLASVKAIASNVSDILLVSFSDYEGNKIANAEQFYLNGLTINIQQKYSMFYTYSLLRFLGYLIYKLDVNLPPAISEYFDFLRCPDDKYVQSRKTWSLYNR